MMSSPVMWLPVCKNQLLVAALLFSAPWAVAETLQIPSTQSTSIVVEDVSSENTYKNWGARNQIFSSFYFKPGLFGVGEYALLRFDISALPAEAIVTSVVLKLTSDALRECEWTKNTVIKVWQLAPENHAWVEGVADGTPDSGATGAYQNQTAYTSPDTHSGDAWSSGGPFNSGAGDLGDELGSLAIPGGVEKDKTYNIELTPSVISQWQGDKVAAEAGLVVHLTAVSDDVLWLSFWSTRASVPAEQIPHLEITYETRK